MNKKLKTSKNSTFFENFLNEKLISHNFSKKIILDGKIIKSQESEDKYNIIEKIEKKVVYEEIKLNNRIIPERPANPFFQNFKFFDL